MRVNRDDGAAFQKNLRDHLAVARDEFPGNTVPNVLQDDVIPFIELRNGSHRTILCACRSFPSRGCILASLWFFPGFLRYTLGSSKQARRSQLLVQRSECRTRRVSAVGLSKQDQEIFASPLVEIRVARWTVVAWIPVRCDRQEARRSRGSRCASPRDAIARQLRDTSLQRDAHVTLHACLHEFSNQT